MGITIPMSDKIDLKPKMVTKDNGHYIMIKDSIHLEAITIINIYTHNIGAPKCIKQILTDLKEELESNTVRVGDFNTPLPAMDRSPGKKTKKEILDLNHVLDQRDLADIYRTFSSGLTI